MRFSNDDLNGIYDRTDGDCHICGRRLSFTNYGQFGSRGAWEVEHSVARARGGTNRRNNLYPACIPCNRAKRDGTTRSARARYGRTTAPLSAPKKLERRKSNAIKGAGIGWVASRLLQTSVNGTAALVAIGGFIGYDIEPDPQKR